MSEEAQQAVPQEAVSTPEPVAPAPVVNTQPEPTPRDADSINTRLRIKTDSDGNFKLKRGDRDIAIPQDKVNELSRIKDLWDQKYNQQSVAEPQNEQVTEPVAEKIDYEKRFKDTEKAYQEVNQKLSKLKDVDPDEYAKLKAFQQQAEPYLRAYLQELQARAHNPQSLQDQANVPSTEEIPDDPAQLKQYLVNLAKNAARSAVDEHQIVQEFNRRVAVSKDAQSFLNKYFEGNPQHPEFLATKPLIEKRIQTLQLRGKSVSLEDAYFDLKDMGLLPGPEVAEAKDTKVTTSKATPEPTPLAVQNQPLPGRYAGVAGQSVKPQQNGKRFAKTRDAVEEALRLKGFPPGGSPRFPNR